MATRQVAWRLKSEGKAEFIRDNAEARDSLVAVGKAGQTAMEGAGAATDRQERRLRALAAAAREAGAANENQSRFNAMLGVDAGTMRSARDSADVFKDLFDQQDKAEQLRRVLDPLYGAQARLNMELAEYRNLARAGAISTHELAAAEVVARKRFDETTMAIERNGRGVSRLQAASRANLLQQGADVLVTGAMGMNPAMIALQQGPQILAAWATSGLKASASVIALGAALSGTAIAAGLAAAAYFKVEDANGRLEITARGAAAASGLSAAAIERSALAAAAAADLSTSGARDIAIEYAATGRIGVGVLEDLTGLTRRYAAVTRQDAKAATKELGAAFADPARGAEQLNDKLNFLSVAEQRHIQNLARAGDEAGAQRAMMQALDAAIADASVTTTGLAGAWDSVSRAASNAFDAVGRAIFTDNAEKLERARGELARLEGVGGGAAAAARARAQAEIDRQYDDAVAGYERQRSAALNQRDRDRQSVIDRYNPNARRLQDLEADRRRLMGGGQGDDAKKALASLNAEISALKAGYGSAAEQQAALARQARQGAKEGRDAAREAREAEREREQAQRRALALRDLDLDAVRSIAQAAGDKAGVDNAELQQRYYGLIAQYAQTALTADQIRVRVAAQLREEALGEATARAKALGSPDGFVSSYDRVTGAMKAFNGETTEGRAALESLRQAGETAFDRIGDLVVQGRLGLKSLGGAARMAAADIVGEFARLAALNPLKNLLFGSNLPTTSSIGGLVGKFLGGIGKNERGTDNWRGGLTWVGEGGKELVDLPAGSKVIPNKQSMAMAGGPVAVSMSWSIDARGAGPREVEELKAEMRRMERALPAQAQAAVQDAFDRRALRPGR